MFERISEKLRRVFLFSRYNGDPLDQTPIDTDYLLSLLREDKALTNRLLRSHATVETIRREVEAHSARHESAASESNEHALANGSIRDLAHAATSAELDPIAGREREIESITEVLCSRDKRNPVLIGEPGAGKTAVVEGLAQRIAAGATPPMLAGKKILHIEPELVAHAAKDGKRLERLAQFIRNCVDSRDAILFIEDLHGLLGTALRAESPVMMETVKQAMHGSEMQCIGACTPAEYQELRRMIPWLGQRFREVNVRPLDAEDTRMVLQARKGRLEKFHGVSYSPGALDYAARWAGGARAGRSLQEKAMDLLDAAGTRVRLRQTMPQEFSEQHEPAVLTAQRQAVAVALRQRGSSRFEAEGPDANASSVKVIPARRAPENATLPVVTREDVEEAATRWADYPYCP